MEVSKKFVNTKLVARALSATEIDLLNGREFQPFIIKDESNGKGKEIIVKSFTPDSDGWTHEKLESIDCSEFAPVWDAYLGGQWIGSSEI